MPSPTGPKIILSAASLIRMTVLLEFVSNKVGLVVLILSELRSILVQA